MEDHKEWLRLIEIKIHQMNQNYTKQQAPLQLYAKFYNEIK